MRFQGFEHLIGVRAFSRVSQANVCIVGLGGVGSWAAEALARSGVGTLALVDLDDVCITNVNRQIQALTSTIGQSKVKSLAARLRDINPDSRILEIERFFSPSSSEQILSADFTVVLDCIDRVTNKSGLIAGCIERGLPVVSCGSAGERIDPSLIRVADLSCTRDDPLLFQVRKKLRQEMGFTRNLQEEFGVPCVYSPLRPEHRLTTDAEGSCERVAGRTSCNDGLGSAVFVTGAMGFYAAAEVVKCILSLKPTGTIHES